MSFLIIAAAAPVQKRNGPFSRILKIADMDIGLAGAGLWVNDNKLKIYGGQRDASVHEEAIRTYNLDGSYVGKSAVVGARHTTDIAIVNRLSAGFQFGGLLNGGTTQAQNDRIDLNTGAKSSLAWMPSSPVTYTNRAVYDGQKYVYVIMNGTSELYRYDVDTGARVKLATTPDIGTSGGMVFMFEGNLYHLGGWFNSGYSSAVYKYDVGTNVWSFYDALPVGFKTVNQGQGGMIGGFFNYISWQNSSLNAIRYDVKNKKYKSFPTGLGYLNHLSCITHDQHMYVVGGCVIPIGSGGYGAAANLRKGIYKLSM